VIRLVIYSLLIAAMAMGAALTAADEGRKLPTIGHAIPVDPATDAPYRKAFNDGMRELGYVDGKNITSIARFANGDPAKLRAFIKELVELRVDVLVGDARLLKEATTTIPIVSPTMGDPVRTGLVASLARPGGNLTGLSAQTYDIWPKQLELAMELVPNLTRLCFLFDTNDEPDALAHAAEFKAQSRSAGMTVLTLPVGSLDDIQSALRTIRKAPPQVLVVWSSPLLTQHRRTIMNSVGHRLPVISDGRFFAEAGALLTYSVDWQDMFRRSAVYVDKILKGAKPGDLPIEQPTKFVLIVNLQTAKALHVKIPESIFVRADKIIQRIPSTRRHENGG
jgi:putative tryptophan/tyrosine transport system substrate-binding protein